MLASLRARLLVWFSLILLLLVAIYATAVTYLYFQSLVRDVDAELADAAAAIIGAIAPDIDGTFDLSLAPEFRNAAFRADESGTYYLVWDRNGRLIDASQLNRSRPMETPGVATRDRCRELVVDGPGGARVLVGQPLAEVHASVRALALTVAGAGVVLLLLSLGGGSFLAAQALAPLSRINSTAGAMIGGDFRARIPVTDTDDELEQVARALNEAFDRMHALAERQRQFTADISHELRTPIATLRAEFEWALRKERAAADYRASIEKGTLAVERLSEIAQRLLLLLQTESAGGGVGNRAPVPVRSIVDTATALVRPLAQARGVTCHTDISDAVMLGDASQLLDALSNLLKNAVEYNRGGGHVFVSTTLDDDDVIIVVRDTGVGIAPDDLPHIFERFYRADHSRTRGSGGAGLGLAIAKSVVEAHGGAIACTSVEGSGTTFELRVPRVRPPAHS